MIPPHLATGRLTHFSADSIDINDDSLSLSLDGKHTFHTAQYAAWQRGPSRVVTQISMTPAKHATLAVPGVPDTILYASDAGITTEPQFDNGIQVEWFNKTLSESPSCLKA